MNIPLNSEHKLTKQIIKARELYLEKLGEFLAENKNQSEEGKYFQALRLLVEAFRDRPYIHLPVEGERATSKPLDDVFQLLESEHGDIEGSVDSIINSLEEVESSLGLQVDEVQALVTSLEMDINSRRLKSGAGEEETDYIELEENFARYGLTLEEISSLDQTSFIDSVEWIPATGMGGYLWFGDVSTNHTSPTTQGLIDINNEVVTIQHLWMTGTLSTSPLEQELIAIIGDDTGLGPEDDMEFSTDATESENPPPFAEGVLEVNLTIPKQISTVSLGTDPTDMVEKVIITDFQGAEQVYPMNNGTVTLPSTTTSKIAFHISRSNSLSPMPFWLRALIISISDSDGNSSLYAQFHDATGDLVTSSGTNRSIPNKKKILPGLG